MKKKIIVGILIAVMSLSMFACGKETDKQEDASIPSTETQNTENKNTENQTIEEQNAVGQNSEAQNSEAQNADAASAEENNSLETDKATVGLHTRVSTGDVNLDGKCDEVLDAILTDGMTEAKELYAIYTWVEDHVRYSGITEEGDWLRGANKVMQSRKGNCYGFCCISRALITRAGYENIELHERGYTHYWNMVKVDGNYYHFDTTEGWGCERFLWTDEQIINYKTSNGIFYDYDPTGYPATPENPYTNY